jgi:hypothetical protein
VPVTVAVPLDTPVKVTEQLAAPAVGEASKVQLVLTVPTAVFDETNVTVPVGVIEVVVVSTTVAVQVDVPAIPMVLGLQLTLVDAKKSTTVITPDVPELPLCVESPPYIPLTVAVPRETGVNVTEQLPETSVQLAPTVPIAVFDDVKVTKPVGVLVAVVVSVTVAVHAEVPTRLIVLGLQDTAADVLSFPTMIMLEGVELEG